MITDKTVYECINNAISELIFSNEIPDENKSLKYDLNIDSLRIAELIAKVEESLEVELRMDDLDPAKLNTVADIYNVFMKYAG